MPDAARASRGWQDQPVLQMHDRGRRDGRVDHREDVGELDQLGEAIVVGEHQPQHAELAGALEATAASIYEVLRLTVETAAPEIVLIAAQEALVAPPERFTARRIG